MNCTTGSHFWLWSGAGSAPSAPDHIRCQCGQYTAHEWRTLEAENARLQALLAERDAEIALLRPLAEYAQHDPGCYALHSRLGEAAACKCGFYEARAALAARGGAS